MDSALFAAGSAPKTALPLTPHKPTLFFIAAAEIHFVGGEGSHFWHSPHTTNCANTVFIHRLLPDVEHGASIRPRDAPRDSHPRADAKYTCGPFDFHEEAT